LSVVLENVANIDDRLMGGRRTSRGLRLGGGGRKTDRHANEQADQTSTGGQMSLHGMHSLHCCHGEPLSRTPFRHVHATTVGERVEIVAGGWNLLKGNPAHKKQCFLTRVAERHRKCPLPAIPPNDHRHDRASLVLPKGTVKVLQPGDRTVTEPDDDIPSLQPTGGSRRIF